jgi:hypothetical protein
MKISELTNKGLISEYNSYKFICSTDNCNFQDKTYLIFLKEEMLKRGINNDNIPIYLKVNSLNNQELIKEYDSYCGILVCEENKEKVDYFYILQGEMYDRNFKQKPIKIIPLETPIKEEVKSESLKYKQVIPEPIKESYERNYTNLDVKDKVIKTKKKNRTNLVNYYGIYYSNKKIEYKSKTFKLPNLNNLDYNDLFNLRNRITYYYYNNIMFISNFEEKLNLINEFMGEFYYLSYDCLKEIKKDEI